MIESASPLCNGVHGEAADEFFCLLGGPGRLGRVVDMPFA